MKTTVETVQKFTPLADRIVARGVESDTKTPSGILLPEKAKEKTDLADVLAVGPDVETVKVGDRVLYVKYSPETHKVDGEELLILREEDCLCTVAE